MNPGNTLLQNNPTTNPIPYYDPNKIPSTAPKSGPSMIRKFPNHNKPQGEAQDLTKMLIEKNSEKKDLDETTPGKTKEKFPPFRDSDDKSKKVSKSPKKSEKKPIRDTVYIKNIPNYYNSVETLSKFYKKFGSIENIQV